MILRRVIAHFRKQEWTAIFLDFLIVVIGVFVGLQVNNWNEQQADARLGRDYVKRLTRDLVEDLSVLNSEIAYYAEVLNSVRQTDALLREADPDPRALIVNAYRATEMGYTAPVRATWDEIISGGHLDLLPQGVIESGLAQYYAFDVAQDVYRGGINSDYRRTVRRIIPMNMQIEMRARCSDVRDATGNILGFVEDCAFKADPAALQETAAALKDDPAVAADLRMQYSFAVSATLNLGGTRNVLETALVALGAAPEAIEKIAP
jgi:hypothetical protein